MKQRWFFGNVVVPGIKLKDELFLLGNVLSNMAYLALSCKPWKNNNKPKVFDPTIRADTSKNPMKKKKAELAQ